MPRTLERLGFTGNTAPPNGVLIRFHRVVRPTLPGVSVAPITATFFGVKKLSSGCDVPIALELLVVANAI